MTTMPRPDFAPAGAQSMTLDELAARHDELKPKSRSFLRVTFPYLKFQPRGQIRSITESSLVLIQGKIHPKTYAFSDDGTLTGQTECWVWTIDDERAEAAEAKAA